jgi:raffinose/stachyose/melibiose transport system substrate-binding protein
LKIVLKGFANIYTKRGNHKMKKWSMLSLILVLVTGLLAACSGSNSSSSPASPEGSPSASPAEPTASTTPQEGGTVEYRSMFNVGEPMQKFLEEAFKEFTAETGIKVNVNWLGRSVITTLRSSMLSGDIPDVVEQLDSELTSGFVDTGLAAPLDDELHAPAYSGGDVLWGDTFLPTVLKQMKNKDGNTYIIPREYYTSGFFYDAALFKKLNIEPPKTWEEFLQVCETLKQNGIAPLAADGTVQQYNAWYFYWLAMREVGPEKMRAAASDKTGEEWRDPGFLEAAKKLKVLADKGYFAKGYEGSAYPAGQINWVNGKAGMILMGAWLPKEVKAQKPQGFDMQMFKFPDTQAYDPNVAEMWTNGWVVLKDGKNKEAAVKLLKYLTQKQVMEKMVDLISSPGPLKDLKVPSELSKQAEILDTASVIVPKWGGLEKEFAELNKRVLFMADDKLFFGKSTPEEFINTVVKDQKDFYANKQ